MAIEHETVILDGRMGEGGGQILRSAISLSMLTGRPLQMHHVRGGRRKPGLLRQHLTALQAAAQICGGRVEGAQLRSEQFRFWPGELTGGEYRFAIGSAGSTSLVFQTLLPALIRARGPSTIRISGGTHNDFAPSFHFLRDSFALALAQMGAKLRLELGGWGFNPAGGGELIAHVKPGSLRPVELVSRGAVEAIELSAAVCRIPPGVATRELQVLANGLGLPADVGEALRVESPGPGNAVWVTVRCAGVTAVFDGLGSRGVSAEQVAKGVLAKVRAWQRAGVPVGPYLADQLLLPMAMAGGGRLRAQPLSLHARTNIEVIERFLPVRFGVTPRDGAVDVEVRCLAGRSKQ